MSHHQICKNQLCTLFPSPTFEVPESYHFQVDQLSPQGCPLRRVHWHWHSMQKSTYNFTYTLSFCFFFIFIFIFMNSVFLFRPFGLSTLKFRVNLDMVMKGELRRTMISHLSLLARLNLLILLFKLKEFELREIPHWFTSFGIRPKCFSWDLLL